MGPVVGSGEGVESEKGDGVADDRDWVGVLMREEFARFLERG